MSHPSIHALIFGDSGAGKSTGAATFPKPMLVFSFDPFGKEMPYLKRGIIADDPSDPDTRDVISRRDGSLLIRVEHYADAIPEKPTAYRRFRTRLVHLEQDIAAEGFQTVVLDSVTFMELLARKEAQYVLNPTSREPRQWFGASTDTLEEVLMIRFGALRCNVVVTAHIDDQKVSVHGHNVFAPAAPGRLSRRSPGAFQELYRAYVQRTDEGTPIYYWQTRSDLVYAASSQIGAPDPCVQDYALLWSP